MFDDVEIGTGARPFVVAEAGVNFRDDLDLAKAFVEEAATNGADAVKFQTHVQSEEMVESEMRDLDLGGLYDRIGIYELSIAEHRELKTYCENHGVTFLSTPFSIAGVDLLERLGVSAYKIGSGELTNHKLLRTVAETGKPMIVSTGMHNMDTINETVALLKEYADSFMLLYCVSEYPTEPESFNLGVIDRMSETFEVPVGFSDHSTGVEAAAVAMARGAALIEKHFTIDRRLPGGDQKISIEPEELARLTEYAHLCHVTRDNEKEVREDEAVIAEWAHHSVVTAEEIDSGEQFTNENLTTKRPGTGVPADEFYDVIGGTAASDFDANEVIHPDDVE